MIILGVRVPRCPDAEDIRTITNLSDVPALPFVSRNGDPYVVVSEPEFTPEAYDKADRMARQALVLFSQPVPPQIVKIAGEGPFETVARP